jgi:16S rRNA (cytidine1402-2'-O)-methyltransferase
VSEDRSALKPGRYVIAGTTFEAPPLAPGLYVVATPIGNLRDITVRALETLAGVALVLCEDTRVSHKLLDHYGIRTPRSPLHEHNERSRIDAILAELGAGKAIALISDAGTPLISDPGFPLVRAAQGAGIAVYAVPGASALLSALSIAGLPTDSFTFIGFLPTKSEARANAVAALADRRETLVFYESPRRLVDTLRALADALGDDRPAAAALELTKRFERVYRGTLGSLASDLSAIDEIKGEAVIVVGGATETAVITSDWQAALVAAMEAQPLRVAVDDITETFGLKRKDVYDAALRLKAEKS